MTTGSSRKSSSMLATGSLFSSANTSAARAGSSLRSSTASIFDLHEGRIVRMQGYMNPAEALEAAGLSE